MDERDAEDVKRAGWRTHSSLAGVGTVGEGVRCVTQRFLSLHLSWVSTCHGLTCSTPSRELPAWQLPMCCACCALLLVV